MLLHKMFWIVLLLLLTGCAPKTYDTKLSTYIVIKTKSLKYADMGFLYAKDSYLKVQIYKFANPVFTLKMHSNICIDNSCFSYERFNKRFLHRSYPNKLIKQIFLAKPIFESKGLKHHKEGFSQKIRTKEYDIIYSVNDDLIRFQDSKNNILIKMKKLGE